MTRTMYDSITAADIPAGAAMVAGYIDLSSRWSAADWARFPNATKVRITRSASTNDGHVLDVERFLATPDQAPGWVQMRRAAGADPSVYCGAAALSTVQAAFAAAGVAQPHYWVAHYDNAPQVPSGCVAKQYINDPTSGGHYDLSAVADYWPGVDPAPGGGGSPTAFSGEDEDMERVDCKAIKENGYVELHPGGTDQARITVYPGPAGVWFENGFFWTNGHTPGKSDGGIGYNPADQHGGQPFLISSITTFPCPKALLAGVGYSADSDFYIIARG